MMRAVWESPSNEGTSYYELGYKQRMIPKSATKENSYQTQYEWEVGRIFMEPSVVWGVDFGARIIVCDTDGERRVSLPASTCAWEWTEVTEEDKKDRECCGGAELECYAATLGQKFYRPKEGEDD